MNTQPIRSDSWTQFVRLAQQARERSQVRPGSARVRPSAQAVAPRGAAPVASFSTGKPQVTRQILGGLFDAYA